MWDFFNRQVTSFMGVDGKRKEFIVCTLCGMYTTFHGNASLKQHLGSHRNNPSVAAALSENREQYEKARDEADATATTAVMSLM